jgi:glycosyltransferase involved in cell wall biosynthesis
MTSAKNILIVSAKSADFGGVEFHVLDLIKAFSGANRVYVMCPRGKLVSEYKKAGAQVLIKTPQAPYDFSFANYVKNFCKDKNIHVVHSHELISAQGIFGAFLAKVSKRVWHVHTPFLQWKHSNILKKIFKNTLNWITNFFIANIFSTDVIALTEGIKKERVRKEWVFYKKVKVIPNAVDTKKFSKKPTSLKLNAVYKKYSIQKNKTIIGNLSRTSAEKGQTVLLEAFKAINEHLPNKYHLLIAGGGELEEKYKDYANSNFKDNYTITGKFDEQDKNALYHLMDYFVFPSFAEGFGYVLVEAMSAGRVVLASDIDVLKNVGGSGVVYFKSGISKDLVKKLESVFLMGNTEKKLLLQQNSSKVQEYSFEAFVKNYSTVYG